MRIGPRFKITDCKIYLNEHPLVWKSDLRYLGLFILSGKRFKCSLQQSKQKFYRAANGILGKIGLAYHCLILSLIDIFLHAGVNMVLRLCAFQKATEIQWISCTRLFFSKFLMLEKRKLFNSASFSLVVYRAAIDLI